MLVLCTGMYRSGSTWSYNVSRETLLLRNEGGTLYCDAVDDIQGVLINKAPEYHHVLLKCHSPDELGKSLIMHDCCKVIVTFREPLEAISSAMQVFGWTFAEALNRIESSLELIKVCLNHALCINHERIKSHPKDEIIRIATYLGYQIDNSAVERINDKFNWDKVKVFTDRLALDRSSFAEDELKDTGLSYYDQVTLFHRGHVRDRSAPSWNVYLTEDQQELARIRLAHSSVLFQD